MGNCCWEPEVARSYRGGIGDTSPTQAAGSDRRRGRPPLPGHRVHWRPGEGALPARAPRGLPAPGGCWGNLLGKLSCVCVFPRKAGSYHPGRNVG